MMASISATILTSCGRVTGGGPDGMGDGVKRSPPSPSAWSSILATACSCLFSSAAFLPSSVIYTYKKKAIKICVDFQFSNWNRGGMMAQW